MKIFYLSEMKPGETAFIYSILPEGLYRRLYDLGFVFGTRVECVAKAPLGGPCAYLIRGALIALRREDASRVIIKRELIAGGDG